MTAALLPGPGPAAAGPDPGTSGEPAYISLAEALAMAEEHHPLVTEAQEDLAAQLREMEAAQAAYAPSVTLRSEGLTVHVDPNGDARFGEPGVSVNASWKLPSGWSLGASLAARSEREDAENGPPVRGSITVSYPLGRTLELDADALELRKAALAVERASRELENRRHEARADVLAALHGYELAAQRLALAQEAYADAVQQKADADEQAAAGAATRADQIAAELELMRAEQEVALARQTLETRRNEVLELLGLEDDPAPERYRFESVLDWTSMPDPGDEEAAVQRAVAASATVWELLEAEETARLELEAARERAGWEASLQAAYTTAGVDDVREGWSVGLQLAYPLADGGQRRRNIEALEEAYARARADREAAVEEIREEVHELYFQLEDARRAAEMARLEVVRAELELAGVERRFELPVPAATAEELAAARRAVRRAELDWREAVQAYRELWIRLQILQGGVDWETLTAALGGGE